ncbi:HAD hydrolase-like protein [Microbacterium halophytorum]|uniref:HAD hydrolase-like protein n=1 Tax=Microbacterium halophytorum TaxID=2067568 RepID=UPI000CFBEE2B|nr:HAD hydrolase-like protein [Microbacterium halophytorum]
MTSARAFTCVLWDVDGVVADASAGIVPRAQRVLEEMGRPVPSFDDMRAWIGPPMLESFQVRAGLSADEAVVAVGKYRALAAADGYASSVRLYPGVPELIREVAGAGVPISTASTKPENQVVAILEHYGLADAFTAISGARPAADINDTKADVVAKALERLEAAGADVSAPVLIGDRHHDVDGAGEHGVPVIFARWGFGSPDEEAGAIAAVDTADELGALLRTVVPALAQAA